MNRLTPHFRHSAESKGLCSLHRKGKETLATEKTGLTDRRVVSKIQNDHDDLEDIDIWGEMCLPAPDRHGEMFDWAAVTLETTNPTNDGVVGPAELLAFCKHSNGAERAVVHAINVTTGWEETKAGNTLLVQNNRLEFTQRVSPPSALFEWTKSTEESWPSSTKISTDHSHLTSTFKQRGTSALFSVSRIVQTWLTCSSNGRVGFRKWRFHR